MDNKDREAIIRLLEAGLGVCMGDRLYVGEADDGTYYVGLYRSYSYDHDIRLREGDREWEFKTATEAVDYFLDLWKDHLITDNYQYN